MRPMRKLVPASFFQSSTHPLNSLSAPAAALPRFCRPPLDTIPLQSRSLAQIQSKHERFPETWYTSSSPPGQGWAHHNLSKPEEGKVDERTVRLGNTIRVLQSRLPTLLVSPLPQEILSPHISLHLFPSTHPHLPTVSGRVAYHAALWTAPMAWGRVPIVGNVNLIIISERMVKNESSANLGSSSSSSSSSTTRSNGTKERLVVRWKTCGKTKAKGLGAGIGGMEQLDRITEWLGRVIRENEEFCGLFIFEFDEEGRILTHIIEHAEESGSWDKASKVVSVTDWLLGKAKRKDEKELPPGLVLGCVEYEQRRVHGGRR